jgi:hypothetical protein
VSELNIQKIQPNLASHPTIKAKTKVWTERQINPEARNLITPWNIPRLKKENT